MHYQLIEPGDFEQVNRLYNRVFSRQRTLDQFEWEFRRGPFGPAHQLLMLDADGRVVGHFGLLPNAIVIGGETVRGGKTENTMIAPEYRGKGLFEPFERQALSMAWAGGIALPWVTRFDLSAATYVHYKVGYQRVGPLGYLYVPLQRNPLWVFRAALQARRRTKSAALKRFPKGLLRALSLKPFAASPASHDRTLRLIDYEEGRLAALLETWSAASGARSEPYRVTLDRGPAYLKWRFQDNPYVRYSWRLIADEGGQVRGYIVWHQRPFEIAIDDLLLLDGWFNPGSIRQVVAQASREWLARDGAVMEASFLSLCGSRVHDYLLQAGFSAPAGVDHANEGRVLMVCPDPGLEERLRAQLFAPCNWYVSNIFTEGLQ